MVGARILFGCVLFLVLDFAFLYLNRQSFQHQIINVQRVAMIPKYGGVVMTYLLLLAGFYYFVLRQYRSVTEAAMLGGLVNGVYELTNYSLLKKWELTTVIKDTTWGAFLWGFTAYMTQYYYPKK